MLTLAEVLSDAAASPYFNGADPVEVNSRGRNGQSPLHWMATLGDVEGVRLLIEANADINATDNEGNTPLHEAVASRQLLAARALVALGATVNAQNAQGETPLDVAEADGFLPTIALLKSGRA